jgi:hypothetical protein
MAEPMRVDAASADKFREQVQEGLETVRRASLTAIQPVAEAIPDEVYQQVYTQFDKGPEGIRYLSIATGCVLALVNVGKLYAHLTDLEWAPPEIMLHVYQIVLGLIILALEVDPDWLGDAYRFRELVYAQAKFLTHLAGRGLLYIFAAVVSIAQSSLEEECAGYLLLVVGILYMVFFYREFSDTDDLDYQRA